MPLKFRLRPGERLAINGAVLRNPQGRAIEVEILNHATLLRERDVMLPEQAQEPIELLYLLGQLLHLDPDDAHNRQRFISLGSKIAAEALISGDREISDVIHAAVRALNEDDTLGVLRCLQATIGRPGDHRTQSDGDAGVA